METHTEVWFPAELQSEINLIRIVFFLPCDHMSEPGSWSDPVEPSLRPRETEEWDELVGGQPVDSLWTYSDDLGVKTGSVQFL